MPQPSESSILEQFLLAPARLPCVFSLPDFAALFPKSLQNSPQVRSLYRDLQRQRNAIVDDVAAEIDAETARGRVLRRHAVRARLRADAQEDTAGDDELQIEQILAGRAAQETRGHQHSLASMVAELEAAVQDVEADLQLLEDEEARLRQTVQQTIGGLSDVRYGRLANPGLREQVLEGLADVSAACGVDRTRLPDTDEADKVKT